jgi:predicted secreted protein
MFICAKKHLIIILNLLKFIKKLLSPFQMNNKGEYVKCRYFELEPNKRYTLKKKSNPTTGYRWYITLSPDIRLINSRYESNQNCRSDRKVGSGGYQYWNIKTGNSGLFFITLFYIREWEVNGKTKILPDQVITIKVLDNMRVGYPQEPPVSDPIDINGDHTAENNYPIIILK